MAKPRDDRQKDLLRPALEDIIDLGHPLVRLARAIDWGFLDKRFANVCTAGVGQPPLPTRLVAELFILKHMHDLADEVLCARWLENRYYQFFCGELRHLAIALGVEAVKAGRGVYFCTLAELITSLAKAEREGSLRERLRFLCRPQLLIVDEIGYLPVVPGGGNLFFQLVNARYERGAMILTSNRGFAEWGDVFGHPVVATALLDRLLHHAVVIHCRATDKTGPLSTLRTGPPR
jgi:hypothetical protein